MGGSATEMCKEKPQNLRGSEKVLWRNRFLCPSLKDGILTGGDGIEKNILVFLKRNECLWLTGSKNTTVAWDGTTRFCLLCYESRWTVFLRHNLLLYVLENILPEWGRPICWTQT